MNDLVKKNINILSLLWVFFIGELGILFLVFYYFLAPKELVQSKDTFNIGILYFAYIFAIVAIPVVSKIYSIFKNKAKKLNKIEQKINLYRTSFIIKAAIFETAGILLLIAFYFNEIYSPLYLFAAVIIAFFFNKPSISNFEKDFAIKEDNAIVPLEDEKITSDTKY